MSAKVILYIEDEDDDVFLMKRAFDRSQQEGCTLTVLPDGQEAVQYLSGSGKFVDRNSFPLPMVLILDLNLPIKSGFEILEWVRSQPQFVCLPLIIFSSSSHAADLKRAYSSGANSYLIKPSVSGELERLIRSVKDYWVNLNCSA